MTLAEPTWQLRPHSRLRLLSPDRIWIGLLVLAVIAFVARLAPVLSGGGLYGYGNYDDGVYFAAAEGLVEGRTPYRDFLLLHPPGIVLALAPAAALAGITTDANAFAVARVCWMAMGALSTVLVLGILWPRSRFGAAVGALSYALFYPAIYSEHSTLLEAPANLVLLLALLIITRHTAGADREPPPIGWRNQLPWWTAGFLVGLSPMFKIWGVVPVLVVGIWVAVRWGRPAVFRLLAGMLVAWLVVLGPFFVAAPGPMWRLVVLDQLGRGQTSASLVTRLAGIAGLGPIHVSIPVVVVAGLAWAAATGLALSLRGARVFPMLHIAMGGLLVITPSWFTHYAGFVAATSALVIGSAAAALERRVFTGRRTAGRLVAVVAVVALAVSAFPLTRVTFGSSFPVSTLAHATSSGGAAGRGCVTSDDPANLIELNVLDRDMERGCRLVVDLGGYSYDQSVDGQQVARKINPRWQRTVVQYLGSGSLAVLSRFTSGTHRSLDATSAGLLRSWRVIAKSGHIVARTP